MSVKDAIRAREEAVARVDANADEAWKSRAMEVIEVVCQRYDVFTADTIWLYLDEPVTPSALGPCLRRAAGAGWCEKSGRMQMTSNPTRHRDLVVWRSLIYGAA